MQIYNADSFAVPAGNFVFFNEVSGGGTSTIAASPNTDGSVLLLQGIDLVDPALLENDHATVSVFDPVTATGGFLLQSFVYAQSQGSFTWRGSLLLRSGLEVILHALVGTWAYTIWGLSVPNFTDVP